MLVKSPMSGSVWKVLVKEGDEVTAGDVVVILESMKMEIPVEAAESGVVTGVKVAEGDFVQDDDLLIILN
ncbi:biotin/lipoyl-binding carrier protein [Sutcliffiella sp. NPDC057660]|uniref:biotin/lipoyl-binding carrier protein n=1 Tax=Sutcliffiella sp. NPDC057660 TaxID=3346199 RepID=UPI0036824424